MTNSKKISRNTLRLPHELKERLKEIAAYEGLTLNALLLQILWQWMEGKEQEK